MAEQTAEEKAKAEAEAKAQAEAEKETKSRKRVAKPGQFILDGELVDTNGKPVK